MLSLSWPDSRYSALKPVFYGILLSFSLSASWTSLALFLRRRKRERIEEQFEPRPIELRSDEIVAGITGLIGNTPLVRINSLSDALGVEILGKAEYMNPGGSVKDRVALRMIEDAERQGLLYPNTGSRIFEGTVGSTGISIATIARARGYEATIIMPDDVAQEKVQALLALGAQVERVRPASIVDKKQFVNLARQKASHFGEDSITSSNLPSSHPHHPTPLRATSSLLVTTTADVHADGEEGEVRDQEKERREEEEVRDKPRGFFADQFENKSNFDAHYEGTGPEIWRQTSGRVDAFVSGAGTGGTIAGIGSFLKTMHEDVIVALSDPEGSGLFNKVKYGVMFDSKEAEGTKRRHQVDTVVEGIGINRLTKNFEMGLGVIDDAFKVTDAEAVSMSRFLVQHDGLFLGSSSACNLVACIKLIRSMGWGRMSCRADLSSAQGASENEGMGRTIVTILCDSGSRHYSKFWNDDYLHNAGIPIDVGIVEKLLENLDTLPFSP